MIRTEIIPASELLASFAPKWSELANAISDGTPFQTVEWQSTWLKHYSQGKNPHGLAIYQGTDLVGLATFMVAGGLWRTLRWIGGGPSDYLGPIARSGFEDLVASELYLYIRGLKSVDLIDLHQVRENQPFASKFESQSDLVQAVSLVLDLPSTFEDYLKQIGKSLRYDVRKLDKELFKSGKATLETVSPADALSGFEIFLDQHRARWKAKHLPGAFVGRSLRFHREWIALGVKSGTVQLKILRVDGVPAGAIYAMKHNRTLYYYQAGFDPSFRSISPGTLLVAACIREGIESGMERFDFMRGDEPYKRRWKPQNRYRNLRLLAPANSERGMLGYGWNQKAHQLELKVRLKLEGGESS